MGAGCHCPRKRKLHSLNRKTQNGWICMIGYKKNLFVKAVKNGRIRWQKHALERMLERDIFRNDVKEVIIEGEIIEEYPGDLPYPSVLILGYPA
jgi:hypothetical protein